MDQIKGEWAIERTIKISNNLRLELREIRRQMAWQRRGSGVWQEGSPNQLSAEDWQGGKSHYRAHKAWADAGNEGDPPAYRVEVPLAAPLRGHFFDQRL